jgi:hypothetical protein
MDGFRYNREQGWPVRDVHRIEETTLQQGRCVS